MKTENPAVDQQDVQVQSEQKEPQANQDQSNSVTESSQKLTEMEAQIKSLKEEKERMANFVETVKQEKRDLKSQYSDVDPSEFEEYLQFKEKAKDDKISQLVAQGRTDEARKMLAEDQANAFKQTESEYVERVSKLQERAEELESHLNEQIETNIKMRKRQFFDGLVRDDDSFHKHHFEAFVKLNENRLDIDEETGKYYALNDQGTGRMVDAKGDLVTFEQYYMKEKSTPGGLFWKAGTGTGMVTANGVVVDKPYSKMTQAEKLDYKRSFKSDHEFMKELARQRKAGQ